MKDKKRTVLRRSFLLEIFEAVTPKIKRKLKRFVLTLAALYILGGVILFFIQDLLLFHPTPLPKNHRYNIQQPFTELNLLQTDGTNLAFVQFPTTKKKLGLVLYFHGNMTNVERYAPNTNLFTDAGYDVWMPDYRGFGKSTGKRTEEGLYGDALTIYTLAIKKTTADSILIYGKSLGTGIATQLASVQSCKMLILETPYYSLPQIAKDKFPIYPVNWLIKYEVPTHRFLPKVKAPVTLFHGTNDEVISYTHAQKLRNENSGIELVTVPGGKHNNLLSYSVVTTRLNQLLSE